MVAQCFNIDWDFARRNLQLSTQFCSRKLRSSGIHFSGIERNNPTCFKEVQNNCPMVNYLLPDDKKLLTGLVQIVKLGIALKSRNLLEQI